MFRKNADTLCAIYAESSPPGHSGRTDTLQSRDAAWPEAEARRPASSLDIREPNAEESPRRDFAGLPGPRGPYPSKAHLFLIGKNDTPSLSWEHRDLTTQLAAVLKAVETASDAVMIADADGRVAYVNPAFEALAGYTVETINEAGGPHVIFADATGHDAFKQVFLGEEVREGETLLDPRDGEPVQVSFRARRVDGDEGATIGAAWSFTNASARKQAEDTVAAHRAGDRLAASLSGLFISADPTEIDGLILEALRKTGQFLSASRAMVIALTPDGGHMDHTIMWTRPGVEENSAMAPGQPVASMQWLWTELEAGKCVSVVHRGAHMPPEAAPVQSWIQNMDAGALLAVPLTHGREIFGGLVLTMDEQAPPWTQDTLNLLHMIAQILTGALGRKRDEARRSEIEAQTRRTQRLESLGVLAGGIAHDFNNILAGVLGNLYIAKTQMERHDPALSSLDEIEKGVQRATELTSQLLAYAGKTPLHMKIIDPGQLLRDTEPILRSTLSGGAELTVEIADKVPMVEADAAQLQQALVNLVENAVESLEGRPGRIIARCGEYKAHTPPGNWAGELPDAPSVCLEVSDTGSGMDEDTLGRIFDPFFSTKFTGRGLGLAAVLGTVQSHRGAISVESKPGEGSVARIILPAAACALATSAAPRQAPEDPVSADESSAGQTTVLVIDDEPGIRTVLDRALTRHGFRVLQAADGWEGVETYRKHHREIEAVVLDLTMPRMSGAETFQLLREANPEIPVILSSGYSEPDVTAQFTAMTPDGFIQKPYSPKALVRMLRNILESGS